MKKEVQVFCRYLIGSEPIDQVYTSYPKAIASLNPQMDEFTKSCLDLSFKWPFLVALLDSGMAVLSPFHPYRQRIYIMFAILESQPEYAHLFLPQTNSWKSTLGIIAKSFTAVIKIFLGMITVLSLRTFIRRSHV